MEPGMDVLDPPSVEDLERLIGIIAKQSREIFEQSRKIDKQSRRLEEQSQKLDEQARKLDELVALVRGLESAAGGVSGAMTQPRDAGDSENRANPSCRGRADVENPLETNSDVICETLAYCPEGDFLFLATVSKVWRATWKAGGRPQQTGVRLASATQSRTEWALRDPAFEETAKCLGGVCCLTAEAGNLGGLQAAVNALGGNEWITDQPHVTAILVTNLAARGGHLDVLKWARQQGFPWDKDTCTNATRSGQLDVLQWLRGSDCPEAVHRARSVVALKHKFEVLQVVSMPDPNVNTHRDARLADASRAAKTKLDVLKWLVEQERCPWDERACVTAAVEGGHLEVLQWLNAHDCDVQWTPRLSSLAAKGGHWKLLRWAREQGCSWNEELCNIAARCGHLDLLRWLKSQGCPWNEQTFESAAEGGRLELLRWLRERGCPWSSSTCSGAARYGHLGALQWLRENGCPWNTETFSAASGAGRLDVLHWLRGQGCPWDSFTCFIAARNGHLEVLQWLRAQGCPWNKGKCLRCCRDVRVIAWIRRQRD